MAGRGPVLSDAATGAWCGLLVGLMAGLFVIGPAWVGVLVVCALIGACWGVIIGAAATSMDRRRRRRRSTPFENHVTPRRPDAFLPG